MAIKGITVTIVAKTQTGTNPYGEPVYETTEEAVENVLVAPASDTDIIDNTDLTGGKAVYTLGIPKGDTHNWEDATVRFFGQTWRAVGIPTKGIEANIPLAWNTKVTVERYD